ncbi:MAG: hypothetical protein A2277_03935 [Desulfobacterales bacterium RIFOXYA12_FULL_46_15]|nr:MAG: hypothetical protein A2277_03935 [Desulfobacterales bacterium RIFOXYA12_FULL_46_15]
MPKNDFRTVNPDLEDVQQKFTTWREERTRRRPIPEVLWEAAINLSRAKEYSINKISKALRLNYSDLKRRISAHGQPIIKDGQNIEFIKLDYSPSVFPSECIIEMEDSSGAKMKMCFRGSTDLDLLELGRSFWNKRP